MAVRIDYVNSELSKGIERMSQRLGATVLMYAAVKAVKIEADMKMHRPWTDRTGMAKATLNAKVSQPDSDTVRITLAHGVEYGIDLEMAHGKRYAIVAPTVEREGPRMITELGNLMQKLQL